MMYVANLELDLNSVQFIAVYLASIGIIYFLFY